MSIYNKMDRLCYVFTQQDTVSNNHESTTTIHSNLVNWHNANQKNASTKEYVQWESISKTLISRLNYHGRSQNSG